jgi:hypothetical protein
MTSIVIEFDGVIHSGFYDPNKPFDLEFPPVEGALEALAQYVQVCEVWLSSPRLEWNKAGILTILSWLKYHKCPDEVYSKLKMVTGTFPAYSLFITPKAYKFDGMFPKLTNG